jgi:hypothetical protein
LKHWHYAITLHFGALSTKHHRFVEPNLQRVAGALPFGCGEGMANDNVKALQNKCLTVSASMDTYTNQLLSNCLSRVGRQTRDAQLLQV